MTSGQIGGYHPTASVTIEHHPTRSMECCLLYVGSMQTDYITAATNAAAYNQIVFKACLTRAAKHRNLCMDQQIRGPAA